MVVNQWLADDLNLTSGSELTLKYFVPKGRRELSQAATTFKVHSVLPMPEKFEKGKESDWTPAFPGLTDERTVEDWEPGFAVDESRIRDKDEDYWDDFRARQRLMSISLQDKRCGATDGGCLQAFGFLKAIKISMS